MENQLQEPVVTLESLQVLVDQERADHQATKGELAKALGALTEAVEVIGGQKETIQTLEDKVADLQTSPAAFPIIEINKAKYEVQTKSFKYKGEVFTLAQLLKDKALQKELVKLGVGFLVEKEA